MHQCPRCGSELREVDVTSWAKPRNPHWDREDRTYIRFACWACTWADVWEVKRVEVEETVDV